MNNNPGKTITIYHIHGIVAKAILGGFKSTGIVPHNRDVFQNCDFVSSNVSSGPEPNDNDNTYERLQVKISESVNRVK